MFAIFSNTRHYLRRNREVMRTAWYFSKDRKKIFPFRKFKERGKKYIYIFLWWHTKTLTFKILITFIKDRAVTGRPKFCHLGVCDLTVAERFLLPGLGGAGVGRWGLSWLNKLSQGSDAQGLGRKSAAGLVSPAGAPSSIPALRMNTILAVLIILFLVLLLILFMLCYYVFQEE